MVHDGPSRRVYFEWRLNGIDADAHPTTSPHTELQGHAIKNQDLLAASGAVSLKGSAGMSALAEDMEAAAQVRHAYPYRVAGCSLVCMAPPYSLNLSCTRSCVHRAHSVRRRCGVASDGTG